MESDIIKISHLNKSFGEVKAVNDLSFRVKKGELFAFLGVNGAGKSTTISILCGLLKKDSGTVQVNGIETDKAGAQTKRMLGVVFQDSVLDKPLTVKENLMSRAALYGITGNAFDKRLQPHGYGQRSKGNSHRKPPSSQSQPSLSSPQQQNQ